MPTAFQIYFITAVICFYGVLLFGWWWWKTQRATEVYKYVTLLFFAEFIEKAIFSWLRWASQYGGDASVHRMIVTSPHWWMVGVPTMFALGLIVFAMTLRVYRTAKALSRSPEAIKRLGKVNKNVLVISNVKATQRFMRGVFVTNRVDYHQSTSLIHGFEKLVTEKQISVVMVGLSAIESSGMRARDVLAIIKRENPWCVVVALSRSPNMYELFETRRAHFDDYVYLPVGEAILMATYRRWTNRVNRWRKINGKDRRKRKGNLFDRRNISIRKQEGDNV